MAMQHPLLAPVFPAGKEPLPPGMTEDDRANMLQVKKYQNYMSVGMESCLGKTAMAGVFGARVLTLHLTDCSSLLLRFCCWWIFFLDVFVLCIRGPAFKTEFEHHTEDDGDLQRYGSRYVEEWKRFWESWGFVCGDRVCH